jgi:hypothetical protein
LQTLEPHRVKLHLKTAKQGEIGVIQQEQALVLIVVLVIALTLELGSSLAWNIALLQETAARYIGTVNASLLVSLIIPAALICMGPYL